MAERAAVLVGTARYAHLPPVSAAENSLKRMYALLTGALCGWPQDQVTVLLDERLPGSIPDQLVEAFSEARDVALFYFVGHGQPDYDDRLCLGLTDTRTDATRRFTTSLPFDAVRDAMRLSPARFKVILLDCCYAGLAVDGAGRLGPTAERDIRDRLKGTGAFVVAACGPYASAWYENEPTDPVPYTHFTKRLVEVVEAGASTCHTAGDSPAGELKELTLGRLVDLLTEELAADGMPVPTCLWRDQAAAMVFATYYAQQGAFPGDGDGDGAAPPQNAPALPPADWGPDLPDPVAYEQGEGLRPFDTPKGRLYPDVPASVWEICDPGKRAQTLLEHGFRLAETDSAQARRVFATAEQVLHTDVAFPFTRYRLLIRAAQETRSSMPTQARRFLGLAAACAAAQGGDRLFAAARDDLRRLHAVIPRSMSAQARP